MWRSVQVPNDKIDVDMVYYISEIGQNGLVPKC